MRSNHSSPTHHVTLRMPRLGPSPSDPWVDETYALIEGFTQDIGAGAEHGGASEGAIAVDGYVAAPMDAEHSTPCIIMASDYLWARFGLQASWQRLDVTELFGMFAQFAADPRWRRTCLSTLSDFYAYLAKAGVVDHDQASRVQTQLARHLREAEATIAAPAPGPRAHNRASRRAQASAARRRSRR